MKLLWGEVPRSVPSGLPPARGTATAGGFSADRDRAEQLTPGQAREDLERRSRFDCLVDGRTRVRSDCIPVRCGREILEVRVASFDGRKAIGLVDGDNAEPCEE